MEFPHSSCRFLLLLVCLAFALASAGTITTNAAFYDWRPLDPADLALRAPVVEKDADAEAIFWEVKVDDASQDLVFSHYIRIKVFTERGRESQSKIEIPFGRIGRLNIRVRDIAARTIKPDGQIVELKKDDIFERTVVKASGVKIKVKSFAMPGVEPGAIIEYRWREALPGVSAQYTRLQFQRDIPVQRVTYYVKPLSNPYITFAMRYHPFQMENPRFTKDKNGFYSTQVTNVPAFREESRMPPEDTVRQWMLLYYSLDRKLTPQRYWPDLGRRIYEIYKPYMKVNDKIRAAAAEATGTAATDEEKLQRLFDYTRSTVKNIYADETTLTPEEREKLKENKTPSDTLARGMGSEQDIDLLFGALATAAGYDARVVTLVDRSDMFFNPNFTDDYFMYPTNVAVRVGDKWQFFDPGASHLPCGMLAWGEEGVEALISDPKEPVFVRTPLPPASKSLERRTAKLSLSEDGTLEGEVRVEYTGHLAAEKKEIFDDDSPAEREEFVRNEVRARMSAAEVTNVRLENITDPAKPLVVSYRVRVPGYAQRTGKRLFIRPAFFQSNNSALFPTSARKYPVYFHYNWSEHDSVRISLPAGFALDNAEAPQSINAGPLSAYTVRAATADGGKTLIYERRFHFGGDEVLTFGSDVYPKLKAYFDAVHEQDNHTIAIKTAAAASE